MGGGGGVGLKLGARDEGNEKWNDPRLAPIWLALGEFPDSCPHFLLSTSKERVRFSQARSAEPLERLQDCRVAAWCVVRWGCQVEGILMYPKLKFLKGEIEALS